MNWEGRILVIGLIPQKATLLRLDCALWTFGTPRSELLLLMSHPVYVWSSITVDQKHQDTI